MRSDEGADPGPIEGRPGGGEDAPVIRPGRGGLDLVAALLTLGLGLAVLYFAVALLGAVDPFGDSIVFTVIAIVLIVAWLAAAWQRSRSDTTLLTRPDRERRGF
jgi:membrane protein implicated in regulation of membrane protease activity